MTIDNIKAELITLISVLFKEQGFDVDLIEYVDLIDDLGMDSVTFISIVIEIEAHFNMTVPEDLLLMECFKSVDDIVKIIANEILSKQ